MNNYFRFLTVLIGSLLCLKLACANVENKGCKILLSQTIQQMARNSSYPEAIVNGKSTLTGRSFRLKIEFSLEAFLNPESPLSISSVHIINPRSGRWVEVANAAKDYDIVELETGQFIEIRPNHYIRRAEEIRLGKLNTLDLLYRYDRTEPNAKDRKAWIEKNLDELSHRLSPRVQEFIRGARKQLVGKLNRRELTLADISDETVVTAARNERSLMHYTLVLKKDRLADSLILTNNLLMPDSLSLLSDSNEPALYKLGNNTYLVYDGYRRGPSAEIISNVNELPSWARGQLRRY